MRHLFFPILLTFLSLISNAQAKPVSRLDLETRFDYNQEYLAGETVSDNSGFKGRYLNIRMEGYLSDHLSYSFRHRLNKPIKNSSLFEATDWVTLTYGLGNWSLSAGKQVVEIGGFEYDAAPIDLYFCSEYWNNIACYQFGISGAYTTDSKKDKLSFQFCQSPFDGFAYNLMWYGSHDFFSSIWSVNMMEYTPGKFINYIALGNRFTFGRFMIDLDLMNRASSIEQFFCKDISIMSQVSWAPVEWMNIFAKLTYDRNSTSSNGDLCVLPGTNLMRVGGGMEFFPLKGSRNLRIHINACHTSGKNASATGTLLPNQTIINAGITWKANLLKLTK